MTDLETRTITVILADDDPVICQALAELLNDDPRFTVVGTGESGAEAALLAAAAHPDLAVVDVQMPQGGVEAITAIHSASASTKVAVYSANRGSRVRFEMMNAGAIGFLSKGDALDLSSALADLVAGSSN